MTKNAVAKTWAITHWSVNEDGGLVFSSSNENTINCHPSGVIEGRTESSKAIIAKHQLNKPDLVENRKYMLLMRQLYSDLDLNSLNPYKIFYEGINTIQKIIGAEINNEQHLGDYVKKLIYSNLITILETYLSDRFIQLIRSDEKYLRAFVRTYKPYKDKKIQMSDLFDKYESIESDVSERISNHISFHKLKSVKDIYEDTLSITFPSISKINESVVIRHDLVHRNGRKADGEYHQITNENINQLLKLVLDFVLTIEGELKLLPKG